MQAVLSEVLKMINSAGVMGGPERCKSPSGKSIRPSVLKNPIQLPIAVANSPKECQLRFNKTESSRN